MNRQRQRRTDVARHSADRTWILDEQRDPIARGSFGADRFF